MRTKRTRRGRVLAALMAGVLAISACAGESGGAEDKVYVYAVNGDPMTTGLNAQLTGGTYPILFSAQLMDTLIFLSDDYKMSPGLAKEWQVSPDGLDLTLHLREGVKWHDGKPFTAEDVKFNFEEIVPLQTFGALLAKRIKSVEITGASTVVVHLDKPYGPLLETVSQQYMLPKHVYAGTDYITNEANKKPIGTGPMKYGSYTPGQEVSLVKNPDYWGEKSQVDRAVYTVMADPNSRAEALVAGEIDGAVLDPSQQGRISTDENTELLTHGMFPQMVSMMFNTRSTYLKDPAVRAALFAALDRDAFAKTAMSGIGKTATGFVPPSFDWAVSPEVDFDKDFPRDLDAINKTLDDAGFERGPDGTRFTLNILYIFTLTEVGATVQMAQSMLKELGIATKLTSAGGAVYSEKLYKKSEFDLAFVRMTTGPDPSLGIANWYQCNKKRNPGSNPTHICDPEIDAAAAAALDTNDKAKRAEALKKMQARAAELMYYAPLAWFNGAFPTISTTRWQGQDAPRVMAERLPWSKMTPAR
ncbi:ABC transporter substrate-binding protein [Nonomuraea glycinis]|uniref:ABC transporter substrate-binding protein n=1 Tax=Nonomuraea glycinis TaxID=2047744 RepID=UPI0033AFF21F